MRRWEGGGISGRLLLVFCINGSLASPPYCGKKDRIKVTIDAPCNYLETNDDTKFIECVYEKDFNPKTKVVCQTKIYEGKDLKALGEKEKFSVFMDAASKLTSALEAVSKTHKNFEVILKCER